MAIAMTDEWIIERFIRLAGPGDDADVYEPWSDYTTGMTKNDALQALEDCSRRWPDYEFRAHRVPVHEKLAADLVARAIESSSAKRR